MKADKLRELSEAELKEKIKDLQEELFNLKFQLAIGQIENPLKIRLLRKDIARAKTVLWERGPGSAEERV